MKNTKALLVISFGTSYEETRILSLEVIEQDLMKEFPDREFYRAWTSGMIRRKLKKLGGFTAPSLQEALEQMEKDGIRDILVQFTHMLRGEEYEKSMETIRNEAGKFEVINIGQPLISGEEDAARLAGIIEKQYGVLKEKEMLALMGHGSAKMAFPAYEKVQEYFIKDGYGNIRIGTVEFDPGIGPVMTKVREDHPEHVILAPMLVVAGDHVLNDMAGDEEDSWKNQIKKEGIKVTCVKKGLGEYEEIRSIYVEHAKKAAPLEEK